MKSFRSPLLSFRPVHVLMCAVILSFTPLGSPRAQEGFFFDNELATPEFKYGREKKNLRRHFQESAIENPSASPPGAEAPRIDKSRSGWLTDPRIFAPASDSEKPRDTIGRRPLLFGDSSPASSSADPAPANFDLPSSPASEQKNRTQQFSSAPAEAPNVQGEDIRKRLKPGRVIPRMEREEPETGAGNFARGEEAPGNARFTNDSAAPEAPEIPDTPEPARATDTQTGRVSPREEIAEEQPSQSISKPAGEAPEAFLPSPARKPAAPETQQAVRTAEKQDTLKQPKSPRPPDEIENINESQKDKKKSSYKNAEAERTDTVSPPDEPSTRTELPEDISRPVASQVTAPAPPENVPGHTESADSANLPENTEGSVFGSNSYGDDNASFSPSGRSQISFISGSRELPPSSAGILDEIARRLKNSPESRLQVKAYAAPDNTTPNSARRLSLSRALAVRGELMDRGIAPNRIDVRALGDETNIEPLNRADIEVLR